MTDSPREYRTLGNFPSKYEPAIEEFEQRWMEGAAPKIEDYLPNDESRLAVLAELIVAELEFRIKAKQDARLDDYLPRFPDLVSDRALTIRIACEEFRLRRKQREPISPSEFAGRYSELAPELEQTLKNEPEAPGLSTRLQSVVTGSVNAELGAKLGEMEWLAKGGMGEVWVARDATLRRQVAMKVIQPKYEKNAEALRRFIAEAEITSRLEHPGIAPVYGSGEHSDGRPCYAMRFIRGESMGDAVRRFFRREDAPPASKSPSSGSSGSAGSRVDEQAIRSRLDLYQADRNLAFRELLQRFVAVCHTAAYAHGQGVLHRDLKPENIRLGEHGETILLDWGLAKELDEESDPDAATSSRSDAQANDAAKTKIGSIYGTPQFMSPEQARRDGVALTHAADIYGLGATLYYLLTGRAPFARETPSKVVDRVILGDYPAPRLVCRDVPQPLEAICLKAMKTKADERYASATELAKDIERYLADEPTSVFSDSPLTKLRRWMRRHRTLASIGGTAALAVAGIFIAWSFVSAQHALDLEKKNGELRVAKNQVDVALRKQTALSGELSKKNTELEAATIAAKLSAKEAGEQRDAANLRSQQVLGLTRSLVEMVSVSGPEGFRIDPDAKWSAKSLGQFSAPEYLDRVVKEVNEKFPVDDLARSEVLAAVGQTKRSIGLFEAAAPPLAEALRIRRLSFGENDPAAAAIEFNLAWCLIEIQGRGDEAVARFRNVVRIRKAQEPRDDAALGLAQAGLMFSLFTQGKSYLQLAMEMGPEIATFGNSGDINIATVYLNFRAAEQARTTRNWRDGDRLYQLVADDIAKIVPPGHPALAVSDFMMAGYKRDRGDMRAAEQFVLRGMKLYRERVGTHTYMCDPIYHLARMREQFGDFDEAEALHREAYWLASLNPKTRRSFRHQTIHSLTSFLMNVGKNDELLELINTELTTPGAVDEPNAAELKARRIWAWMESGRFAPVITELSGPWLDNPHLTNPQSVLCRALFEAGRFEEAKAIMPIEAHLSRAEFIPRPAAKFVDLLRRIQRHDTRSVTEIENGLAKDEFNRDHSDSVGVLMQLARKRMELSQFDEATANLREALDIANRRKSTFDPVFLDLILDQALLRLASGDKPAAITEIHRAIDAVQVRYPPDAIAAAEFLHQAGLIAAFADDKALARTYFDAAIKIRSRRWNGVNHRLWSPVLDRIEATPDPADRRDFLREQIRQMSMQGVSSWRIAVLSRELGAAEKQLGVLDAAERNLLEAWRVFLPMLGAKHELAKSTATELATVYEALNRVDDAAIWRKRSEGE